MAKKEIHVRVKRACTLKAGYVEAGGTGIFIGEAKEMPHWMSPIEQPKLTGAKSAFTDKKP